MTRKDKRSLLLSFILGDGCLHYLKRIYKDKLKIYGSMTIDHGLNQTDYVTWKAQFISNILNKNIKIRQGHNGKSVQFAATWRRFKAWRKFTYPNDKKKLTNILPFILHPEFAIMIWLMDDGYVEPSYSTLSTGIKENYGARFRIFTESQSLEDHETIITWFKNNLKVTPKISLYHCNKRKKRMPFLKFTQEESLFLWEKIRFQVMKFNSMKYKFRHIEQIYIKKLSQRTPIIIK